MDIPETKTPQQADASQGVELSGENDAVISLLMEIKSDQDSLKVSFSTIADALTQGSGKREGKSPVLSVEEISAALRQRLAESSYEADQSDLSPEQLKEIVQKSISVKLGATQNKSVKPAKK